MAWASVFARCVDPDGLLDAFRRAVVPLGAERDARHAAGPGARRATRERIAEAQRCRPRRGRTRASRCVRAVATGALDRALDVAATLEVRGYAIAGAAAAPPRAPWSRHDLALLAAAAALVALTIVRASPAAARYDPYDRLSLPSARESLLLAAARARGLARAVARTAGGSTP